VSNPNRKREQPAQVGRPRDPEVDRTVLVATRELLLERGYERLSIEAVARRAGVGKASIYRRWPGKAPLVLQAAFTTDDLPRVDDFAGQLRALVRLAVADFVRDEARAALPGLIVEGAQEPQVLVQVMQPELELLRAAMKKGEALGEVRPNVDPFLVLELYSGAVMLRSLRGVPLTTAFADDLFDTLLRGVRP